MKGFDAGEHALIGDLSFEKANIDIPNEIRNLEVDMSFSYGQLIAMSGDMYKSVEEISLGDVGVLNSFFKRNRKSLKTCINKEIESIKKEQEYSGCDDVDFAKKKLRYVTLAHDNFSHFAWHNIKAYISFHNQALWFAQLAYLKCDELSWDNFKVDCEIKKIAANALVDASPYRERLKSKYHQFPKLFPRTKFSKRYLRKLTKKNVMHLALFANAFADHFLTDAFSAGHLRIPRSQIDTYVDVYGKKRLLSDVKDRVGGTTLSGALTQLLHNTDGYMAGLKVTNSLKQEFLLRSDKQLFSHINQLKLSADFAKNKQLSFPIQATISSIEEVMRVVEQGQSVSPQGVFKALEYVPFILNSVSISEEIQEKIVQLGSIKKLVEQMSPQMQLIMKGNLILDKISYKDYVTDFIDALPSLMVELQKQIETESDDLELSKRIPDPLLQALLKIH